MDPNFDESALRGSNTSQDPSSSSPMTPVYDSSVGGRHVQIYGGPGSSGLSDSDAVSSLQRANSEADRIGATDPEFWRAVHPEASESDAAAYSDLHRTYKRKTSSAALRGVRGILSRGNNGKYVTLATLALIGGEAAAAAGGGAGAGAGASASSATSSSDLGLFANGGVNGIGTVGQSAAQQLASSGVIGGGAGTAGTEIGAAAAGSRYSRLVDGAIKAVDLASSRKPSGTAAPQTAAPAPAPSGTGAYAPGAMSLVNARDPNQPLRQFERTPQTVLTQMR